MELNGNKTAVFERIAHLVFLEVPDEQIAAVIDCSVEELREIIKDEDYRRIYGAYVASKYEDKDVKNAAWDDVEAMALTNLMDIIDIHKADGDFLLKTAMVANKAQRRHVNNQPINAQGGNLTAVLHLQPTFVKILQQYGSNTGDRPVREIPKKNQNFLDVNKVEELLEFRPGPEFVLKER